MSCRVMSRGVGMVMINHILQMAKERQVKLYADFVSNNRNRMMYVTYKFAGFKEIEKRSDAIVFENDLTRIQPFPPYMQVTIL
jgi:predicted enzyme involved in methoxymalonyl-ACP biosynthesis